MLLLLPLLLLFRSRNYETCGCNIFAPTFREHLVSLLYGGDQFPFAMPNYNFFHLICLRLNRGILSTVGITFIFIR